MAMTAALLLLLQTQPPQPGLVASALEYLARHQAENGSWGRRPAGCTCEAEPGPAAGEDVEATALAVLAFLGAGFTSRAKEKHGDIPIGTTVERGLLWLIGRQKPDGSFGGGSAAADALGALAFSEALSLMPGPLFRGPGQKAMDFLVANPATDARGLFYQGMALKSAELSELPVPKGAAGKATEALAARRGDEPWSIFILSSTQILKIFTYRSKMLTDFSGIPGTVPSRMEMETVYAATLALFQGFGPEGPRWQDWSRILKAWSVPAQNQAGESCARGSWKAGGTCERVKTAALGALAHEFYYATVNVWPK